MVVWCFEFWVVWLLLPGTCGFGLLLWYRFGCLGVWWANWLFGVGGLGSAFCECVGLVVVFAGYVVFSGSVLVVFGVVCAGCLVLRFLWVGII